MNQSIITQKEENHILLLSRRETTFLVSLKTTGTKDLEEKWDSLVTIRKCWTKDLASPRVSKKFLSRPEEKIRKFTKILRWKNKWCTRASSQKRKVNQTDGEPTKASERHLTREQSNIWREHSLTTIELITNPRNLRKTYWLTWANFDPNFIIEIHFYPLIS